MTNKIYIERYNRLIKYCKNRTLNDEEYSEIHHIIPRCMSGDNGATNLIRLSAKEHYLAHWMLWKAYGTPGLVGAFFMMMVKNTQQDRRIMPSYLYEKLRKEMSKIASERGKTKQWITDGVNDKFVDKNEPIPPGWYNSRSFTRDEQEIDIYKRENDVFIFLFTAHSTEEALDFINSNSRKSFKTRSLKSRCLYAREGKSSKAGDFYVCYSGDKPSIKKSNNMIGCLAAQKVNIGKKRPKHSKFMIEFSQKNFYIPEGIFLLQEASDLYGRDLVMSWCRNPDIQISKMMIMKAKKLSLEEHSHWIGKTRRAIGFWHRDNAI